jgi:hypothetical protein
MKPFNSKNLAGIETSSSVVPLRPNSEWSAIKPLTYEDIVNSAPKPMEYVLYPWLPKQGIAFIYAATGVGKTLFTLNVAYAIASGGTFLKYRAQKPRKVLYIDGEMSYIQVYSRFMQIVGQQGELDYKENFQLLTPEKSPLKLPRICSPQGQEFYNQLIKERDIEVLVLDNLSMLSAIDESNSEQWKVIQDWLIELRARGITVIIVHHAGKDKKGYRGTSRMLDCADTAISLQDVSSDQLENEITNTKKFKIEYHKARAFGGKDSFPFEVSLTKFGWEYQSMEQNNVHRIAEMLNMGIKQHEIAKELVLSRPYICKLVKKARATGLLTD